MRDSKSKTVIIYNRVSTIMQDKNESLTEQTDECIRYCKTNGYEIYKILKDVKSGTKDDRAGYLELKKHIRRRDFDILVVLETSRIARKMKELVLFFSLLNENNIEYISIREPNYNTTTPDGKFAMNIRLGLIQFERDNTAERVTDRLYFKASKGQWVNGKPPIGYKLVNKRLEIDEEKAEIVKNIYEDFLNGYSLNQINNKLQFSWGSKQVKRILTNPTYKGYIRYGTRSNRKKNNREAFIVKGWHEAIIPEDKWEKVQEMYKSLNRKASNTKPTLLGGLLKCKECGNNYIRKRGGSYDKNLYYGCNFNNLRYSDKFFYKDILECSSATIKGDLLEKAVIDTLKKQINDLNFNDIEIEKKRQVNIKQIDSSINRFKNRLNKIYELYIEDEIPKDKYLKDKKDIEARIISLEKQKKSFGEIEVEKSNNEMIQEYFSKIDLSNIEEANRILKIIVNKIVVYKKKKTPKDDFEVEIYLNI
mgnify:FL=1